MLLNFPISKVRLLVLRFERVSSLFSAFVFFASFLLCFSAFLFCSSHPTMTPSFHLPFASRIASPSESLPSSLLLLSALGYFSLFFFLLFGSSSLFFSSLVTSNFASGHHTITPSFHLPFASPSLARRNARND